MEFIHRPYIPGETIAALATPPGEGGIAIIRISGKRAIEIGDLIFSGDVKKYASHTAHFGRVLDREGKTIDEAILLVMLGKRSFTGEDTIEVQCHGGMIAARKILKVVFEAGARPAGAGEFTFKAFMNGKLDLAQAEAVQELIGAKNEKAFSLAGQVLEGRLSEKIRAFQKKLNQIAAIFEAWVDFPEEGLEFATEEDLCMRLRSLIAEMENLLETYHDGKRLSHGISLAIIGEPNVGKSSLMNALLGKERAIVTPIAGTTRDVLEEEMTLDGLHFRLIDTAGIRETTDIVEKEGVIRSHKMIAEADLILLVLDVMKGWRLPFEIPHEKTIAIWNKCDLLSCDLPKIPFLHVVKISAKERWGFEELQKKIQEMIWTRGAPQKEDLLLSKLRHFEALSKAKGHLHNVDQALQEKISPEFLAFDIRAALFELGSILGTNVTEEILNSIFAQFCIGK